MGRMEWNRCGALAALLMLAPAAVAAQDSTAVVTAGPEYEAGELERFLAGANWRDLWTTPVEVPVLDLSEHGGGLEPVRRGGRQTRTLHFRGGDGRLYIFRSANKYLHDEALPVALRHTWPGDVVQDQISTLLPAAGLLMGPLYEAAGLLHPWSTLVVMPDDPRLGEYREEYAGMLGQIEENPQEGPDDTPGFAGSSKLVGVDTFLERLDASSDHRVHAPEYLAARLIQFLVADSDRGSDQWRFAEFPDSARGGSIWRPVARDHDFAFMRSGGVLGEVAYRAYTKLVRFDESFESLRRLTFMTAEMDRRLLVELPRQRWDSVVAALQTRLTNDVIRAAADRLPPEWHRHAAARIETGLRTRRDSLHTIAAEFFDMVSREADVYATDEAERAEIERLGDGSVEVRLFAGTRPVVAAQPAPPAEPQARARTAGRPWFQRRFMPDETDEIRLYMQGGDDAVRVTGSAPHSIHVRVIGGAGDDELVDASTVSRDGTRTVFYTADGTNRVERGPNTRVDDRPFDEWMPGRPRDLRELVADARARADDDEDENGRGLHEDVVERLTGEHVHRDWGARRGLSPYAAFRSGTGLLIGGGPSYTRYGFRHEPYEYHAEANVLYSLETGGFGIEGFGDYRLENSNYGLSVDASATQYEVLRFYGFGNDTDRPNGASARVERDQITIRPAGYWERDRFRIAAGPIFRWGDPRFDSGSPLDLLRPDGSSSYAQAGAGIDLEYERGITAGPRARGYSIDAAAFGYPGILDAEGVFGTGRITGRAWIPIGRPYLALRAGSEMAWGDFPFHEAAFLGGRRSLRGYETDRFAGDVSLFGTTELHVPIRTITLLVRGELGVFGLADAGRVWFDGDSAGGWHTSIGGGAWFSSLGRVLTLSVARGELTRFYLKLGTSL